MLPHRDPRLSPRRFPIPVGERRKVRFLIGRARSRKKTVSIVQNDSTNHQEHLREDYGGSKHHSVRRDRRDEQESAGVRPHMGQLRADLRAGTHVDRS